MRFSARWTCAMHGSQASTDPRSLPMRDERLGLRALLALWPLAVMAGLVLLWIRVVIGSQVNRH